METRNVERLNEDSINCELNHPLFGWIPFTADRNDVSEFGREIFAQLDADA